MQTVNDLKDISFSYCCLINTLFRIDSQPSAGKKTFFLGCSPDLFCVLSFSFLSIWSFEQDMVTYCVDS